MSPAGGPFQNLSTELPFICIANYRSIWGNDLAWLDYNTQSAFSSLHLTFSLNKKNLKKKIFFLLNHQDV